MNQREDHTDGGLTLSDFTKQWFLQVQDLWEIHVLPFISSLDSNSKILEIGSYEGMSALYFLENSKAHITCLDLWEANPQHSKDDMSIIENRFDTNLSDYINTGRVRKLKGLSKNGLLNLIKDDERFNCIYIDGSHHAKNTIQDAILSDPMLVPGGLMIFDDYKWNKRPNRYQKPKVAIDLFYNSFADEYHLIHKSKQVILSKRK